MLKFIKRIVYYKKGCIFVSVKTQKLNIMKTKLVVVNENTLGYIFPETPNTVGRLASKVVSGNSLYNMENQTITKSDKVRLASKKDFENFRVTFGGYENDEYQN